MGYSIYGAGATSDNRIIVKVACGEPAVVPYIVKYEGDDSCNPVTEFYNYTREEEPITICNCDDKPAGSCDDWITKKTKEGSFTGEHNLEVYYKIISEIDCHEDPDCETGCTVGNYWIKKGEGNSIKVEYELFNFKDCDTVTKDIKTAVTECSSDIIEINTDCGKFYINYECETGCTDPGSTIVNIRGITFNPLAVEYSGGTVSVTISYEKIVKDKDCNEYKSRGSIIIEAEIDECDPEDEEVDCCSDHVVDFDIPKTDILKKLGFGTGDTVVINYKNKPIDENLTLSITQKADPSPDCDKDCNYKITYCVLEEEPKHKIDIGYETYWGSRDWSGKGPVPPYGGRIRVSFDYLATATPIDSDGNPIVGDKKCKPYSFNGKDSVIIEVPPCEEIGPSVNVSGVILYKEQTSNCSFPKQTIKDTITRKDIVMNKISYTVSQVCTGTCEPIEYKKYKPVEKTVEACDTIVTGEVPYTLIKVKEDCTTEKIEGGKETITIQIEPNETDKEITVETDYFKYTQKAGPCHKGQTCTCDDALEIITGEYKDICDEPEMDYDKEIHISCKKHEYVNVPYRAVCDGVVVSNGNVKVEKMIGCNEGKERTFEVSLSDGTKVSIIQAGNCDCGGPEPPTPVDCNPTDNPNLNKFLSGGTSHNGFNNCVKDGLKITATDTKCTYTILDMVYKAATANTSTNNDTSIAWALAEMLTELTPELISEVSDYGKLTKPESYFIEATTYGGVPDMLELTNETKKIYDNRISGAELYTKLRHDKFCDITNIAAAAREELLNKGVTLAKLLKAPKADDGSFSFPRGSLINPTKLVTKFDSTSYPAGGTYDANDMTNVMMRYSGVTEVKHYFGDAPFLNKDFCPKRYYDIMIGEPSDGKYVEKWLKLFDNATDPQDAILNVIKRGIDGSDVYKGEVRIRPSNGSVSWYPFVLECLSDCPIEKKTWAKCEDKPESEYPCGADCNGYTPPDGDDFKGSYPSGHAGKSYIAGLAYLEASGIDKLNSMKDFGRHRVIVRAHWATDVLAGQVVASTTMGILNGTSDFLDEIKTDFIDCGDTPTPPEPSTDCICTGVNGKFNNGPGAYCRGETPDLIEVGSGRTGTNCSGIVIKATKIKVYDPQNNDSELPASSAAVASIDDVRVDMSTDNTTYTVKAKMRKYPDTTLATTKTRIYFNVLEYKDSTHTETEESYINIYQKKEE